MNDLTINISEAEARVIEAQADPIRKTVAKMFERYRNGQCAIPILPAGKCEKVRPAPA